MPDPTPEQLSFHGFEYFKLDFDAFDLYRHFHRNATHEDLTFYGSFPLLMYRRHGVRVIDGYFFLFRHIRNDAAERLDVIGLPIDERGRCLDIDATSKVVKKINRGGAGRIICLHPSLNERYGNQGGPHGPRTARNAGLEYIYSNADLAALAGGSFRNLRRNVNRFANKHDVEIVPYEKQFRADADRIYDNWRASFGAKYDSIWDRRLFANLLDRYGSIEHHLFVVIDRHSNEKVGVFDAVPVSAGLAIGVIRKLDARYSNLAEYCQHFLARHLHEAGIEHLNDGDDAGHAGLAELKRRFHPVATHVPLYYRFKPTDVKNQ